MTTRKAKKNKKHFHVFAIIRYDGFREYASSDIAENIIIKKIVWSQDVAEREVTRLNQLNGDKGVCYFWQMTRLEKKIPAELLAEVVGQNHQPDTTPKEAAREVLGNLAP